MGLRHLPFFLLISAAFCEELCRFDEVLVEGQVKIGISYVGLLLQLLGRNRVFKGQGCLSLLFAAFASLRLRGRILKL